MDSCVEKYKARRDARLEARKSGCDRNDYGVPGMKWGEHKAGEENESSGIKNGSTEGAQKSELSGDSKLDRQYDRAKEALDQWNACKDAENKAMLKAAVQLGIKKSAKGSLSAEERKKIRASNNPDVVAASKATQKAMNKHIRTTGELKKLYNDYRKKGGKQIKEYYAAASEWDDND